MKLGNGKKRKFRIDPLIFIPMILISLVGIVALLSTTIGNDGVFGDTAIVQKQISFIVIGLILYIITSLIDISLFKYIQIVIPIYVITVLLLIALFPFGPVINNVQRWLVIGGVQIQPSEIAKVTVILTTACIFSFKGKYNQWLLFFISFLAVLPIIILIYLEPAGSMSFLTLVIWFLVAFTGLSNQLRNSIALLIVGLITSTFFFISFNGNWLYLIFSGIALIIGIFAYYYRDSWRVFVVASFAIGLLLGTFTSITYRGILRDYQRDRIEAFLNPRESTEDIGFNVNQARIAIGSGQIWGKGFGNGTQSKRDFLPEHQTDFIYASFAEEFGLVGSLFLITLFGIVIVKSLIVTVDNSGNQFYSMILIGLTMKLLLEIFINIGTNVGIIPATGIPLPLVSAGGTITVMTLFSLGVVQSIINRGDSHKSSKNIIDNY